MFKRTHTHTHTHTHTYIYTHAYITFVIIILSIRSRFYRFSSKKLSHRIDLTHFLKIWLAYVLKFFCYCSFVNGTNYNLFCLKRRHKLCNVRNDDVTLTIFFNRRDYIPDLRPNEKRLRRRNGSRIDSNFQSLNLRVLLYARTAWDPLSLCAVSPFLLLSPPMRNI